jgi:hypothetical protein
MANEVESPASDSVSPETQQILAQLRNEGNEIAGDSPAEPQEAPVSPQDAPQSTETPEPREVPSQDKTSDTEANREPLDRSPKEPVLIPAWEHKIAEKRWEREREALNAELEVLRKNPTVANQQAVAQTASNLKELAQHYGLELDDAQEKFFGAILDKAVPKGLNEKLEALERERNIAFLESQYDTEFRKDVVPMLVERYGVDEQQLAELKAKLHNLAFTETYAKVPLKKVFLAEESEFKLSPNEPRSTVKAVKSGKTRGTSIDFDSVDEETFARMSPEDIERYAEHQISKSGGRKWQ